MLDVLQNTVQYNKFDDLDDAITFNELNAVDHTELITHQLVIADFIELHNKKLTKLVRIFENSLQTESWEFCNTSFLV